MTVRSTGDNATDDICPVPYAPRVRARLMSDLAPGEIRAARQAMTHGVRGTMALLVISIFGFFGVLLALKLAVIDVPRWLRVAIVILWIATSIALAARISTQQKQNLDAGLRRRFPHHCPRCAYDAGAASITRCPECGAVIRAPS